jgi:hypothetical protein
METASFFWPPTPALGNKKYIVDSVLKRPNYFAFNKSKQKNRPEIQSGFYFILLTFDFKLSNDKRQI